MAGTLDEEEEKALDFGLAADDAALDFAAFLAGLDLGHSAFLAQAAVAVLRELSAGGEGAGEPAAAPGGPQETIAWGIAAFGDLSGWVEAGVAGSPEIRADFQAILVRAFANLTQAASAEAAAGIAAYPAEILPEGSPYP